MEKFIETVNTINDNYWLFLVIPLLTIASLYFTFRSRGVQFRLFPQMIRNLKEPPAVAEDGRKGVSAFGAFAISAAARVGTGNVVGVSIAISTGGPGAVFWMWTMASLVAAAAFVESTLAQAYKVRSESGFVGGPAYYMQHGLKRRWLGVVFAVVLIFTFPVTFMMVQSNTFTSAINGSIDAFGGTSGTTTSIVITSALVVLLGLVIFGGARRVAHVSEYMVPIMAGLYLIVGILVVAVNIEQLPGVFTGIFESAFGLRQIGGATIGTAIIIGVQRGMFSNEGGLGSAPNAGATASVSHPVKQGLTQSFGVFFDTIFICSITAFIVLVSTPELGNPKTEDALTQIAVDDNLGSWAVHLLTVILLFLTFTSCIGNYYYGETNLRFLTTNRHAAVWFRIAILGVAFVGGLLALQVVWALANVTMGVMAVVNLVAIVPLGGIALKLLKDYDEQRKAGLDPVFTRDRIPELEGTQCWEPIREKVR
ncbi:alanine/glycine:cation symporter family protein [Stackebrandtia nassauensis]|uniref:Amino acid carrier protein n=1 Tax=Stackebrandtia nassauensis (strain DSM 44728 / CIP 108903 / NRRL B-16338 / NBRC 102104 / LLR-40K-21) TaxID=446470 RepID=D3PXJ8_STANL|nr:alanine/glycine:cation symporter family protein [Stackebrandtia nassauensis]ADD43328.1 amino acid carrier protein [Stackebrandtia nassauensis DSM 44728]